MTPLIFAAAVAASPAVLQPANPDAAAAACAPLADLTVAPDGVPFRKLNQLPPGIVEHAVWRTVSGCPVREIVYKGQRVYIGPSIPKLETGPAVENPAAKRTRRIEPIPAPNAR